MDEAKKLNNQLILNYLGLGIFLWLADNAITNLIEDFLRDALISTGFNPVLNFWISNILALSIFAFFIYLFVRYLRKSDLSKRFPFRKCLIITVIILVISIVFQFISIFITNFLQFNSGENWGNYFDSIYSGKFYSMMDRVFYFLRYAIAGFMIFRKVQDHSSSGHIVNSDILDL